MYRYSWLVILALVMFVLASPCLAESLGSSAGQLTGSTPAAKQVGIDQNALDVIKAMSEKLAGAPSLTFTVRRGFEEPASNGQPLVYIVNSEVSLRRPDKLKVIVKGDGPKSEFYYDGKEIAVYLPADNLIAIESVPPKLDDMLPVAFGKAGIYFPFVDFIAADPYKEITEDLISAFVIGRSTVVGDTLTDIIAISNRNFQAQLWIGAKDRLPRLVYINAIADKSRRSVLEFHNWRLNAEAQTFKRPPYTEKAGRMKFEAPEPSKPTKQ